MEIIRIEDLIRMETPNLGAFFRREILTIEQAEILGGLIWTARPKFPSALSLSQYFVLNLIHKAQDSQ